MSDAKAVQKRRGKTVRDWMLAAAALTGAVATIVAAFIAAHVAITLETLSNDADREAQLLAERTEVYSAYIADLEKFDEFLWDNTTWVGGGAVGLPPVDLDSTFWEPARDLQVDLSGNYAVGLFFANDEMTDALQALEHSRGEVFLRFKCMSGLQNELCEIEGQKIDRASHQEIAEIVTDWSVKSAKERENLRAAVRGQAD
jgi:hypothetical protein